MIGVAVIAVASMIASFLDVPWSMWPVVAIAMLACAVAWPIGTLRGRAEFLRDTNSWRWAPLVAVAAGVALLVVRTLRVLPSPELIAQSFDNVFHLNAVRFILDTGRASPWDITTILRPDGAEFFYPNAWHAIVALIAHTSGVSVPIASNAALVVVACVVWPLGAVVLSRVLFGSGTAVVVSAGVLSAGMAAYPYMLIAYMGTYPLMLSIALLPVAVAASAVLARVAGDRVPIGIAAVLVTSIPALGSAHPSALVMLSILTVPLATIAAVRVVARHPLHRSRVLLGLLAYIVGVCTFALVARPNFDQPNALRTTAAQALGEIALGAQGGTTVALVVSAATIAGVILALRRRRASDWAAVALWVTVGGLYLAAVGPDEFLRLLIGGPWYSDAMRVAAFAPIVIVPLAAQGAGFAWTWFSGWLMRHTHSRPKLRVIATTVASLSVAAVVLSSAPVTSADASLRATFVPTDDPLATRVGVGPEEHELIRIIEDVVPKSDVIANNPRDGSGVIYALTSRHVLVAHMLTTLDHDREVFYAGIGAAESDDPACEVAQRLGIRWIVRFHPDKTLSADDRFDGLEDIDASPNVELARRVGDSSLFRITGCGFE